MPEVLVTYSKEISLENKLRQLFALQLIDNNLDELEELKGDLPHAVRTLEEKLRELKEQLDGFQEEMKNAFSSRENADNEILSLKDRLTRYKTQQFEVKNNREYDALTREMDSAEKAIAKLEKEMESLEIKATKARSGMEETKVKIEALEIDLVEKRGDLAEVSKTTEAEELKFAHDREKIVVRIAKEDLDTYERIRKAKNGRAVVPVKRGACGGCHGKVPPQTLLELRQNRKLFVCEHCGRILVSDEIAESSTSPA